VVVILNEQKATHESLEAIRQTLAGMAGSRNAAGPARVHAGRLLRSSEPSGSWDATLFVLRRLQRSERTLQVPTRSRLFLLLLAAETATSLVSIRADAPASG